LADYTPPPQIPPHLSDKQSLFSHRELPSSWTEIKPAPKGTQPGIHYRGSHVKKKKNLTK